MASLFQRQFASAELEERPTSVQDETESAPAERAPVEIESSLIPATQLPSAAEALAELFTETVPVDRTIEEASQVEKAAEQPARSSDRKAAKGARKRRNIFARLFAAKRAAAVIPEEVATSEQASAEVIERESAVAAAPEVAFEPAPVDLRALLGMEESPIAAEELPSAAHSFAELFPSEQTSTEADISDSSEVPIEHPTDVAADTPAETKVEEVAAQSEGEVEVPGETETQAEAEAEIETDAAVETATPADIPAEEIPVESEQNADVEPDLAETPSDTTEPISAASEESANEEPVKTQAKDSETISPAAAPLETPEAPRRAYKDWAFDEKLASHREWVESHGVLGKRADLSGVQLDAMELISVNLRLADLHDANLRASDLLLADLRDACLVRADLEDACLVGANLEGANLEGASLETAMGMVPRQIAGANLRDALLAPHLMEFEAAPAFESASQNAFRYFTAMTAASVVSWLVMWKTRDTQLLTDSAVVPFLHSRAAATALPTAESYLIVPVALFIVYLVFHFHLQHLWDAVGELPAIFPDGHSLGDRSPGIIGGLLRTHFRWMNPDPSSTRLVEKGICLLAAYWVVPGTLLLFWVRYLTRQDIHGTLLQASLVVIATGIAFYATTKVGRPQEKWEFEKKWAHRSIEKLKAGNPISIAAGLGAVLIFLSVGTLRGVPHEQSRAPQYSAASIRRWAPNVFWSLGLDPYADLTEASISRKPSNWTGGDDQVASVDGLRMNNARFRYAQAYGAFFANAHLWHADLQGAFLSDADMRGADLGQSNLKFAVMDHAQMAHANLDRSNLDGADLRRADLRDANLSYCSLEGAILVDARLDGANLYTAHLMSATLTRASLQKADLRESFLSGAHMDHADLRAAYLWSAKLPGADLGGAQLGNAILIGADLHGANLGGAQLSGTVLNDANLTGTSLEGADLRGALGLNANQVCSAKSRRGALLDDGLAAQVEAQCGVAK